MHNCKWWCTATSLRQDGTKHWLAVIVVLGHMARPDDMARLWVLDSVCKNIYAIN